MQEASAPPAGWIRAPDAVGLVGYRKAYIWKLARLGRVEAVKVGRDWWLNPKSLRDYKAEMDALGYEKHNPKG